MSENVSNKFYDLYMSDNVDESILNIKLDKYDFEDHFWHLACLALYYEKNNDSYAERYCLSTLCDLNYAYSAMLYFDKYDCLPRDYKVYIKPFKHKMKNDKSEARIAYYNKKEKNKGLRNALKYSLMTLVCIPIMLLLIFVFHVDTHVSMIISIAFVFILEIFVNPIASSRKIEKMNKNRVFDSRLASYLKFYDKFAKLFQNELYMDLIKAKDENKITEIVNQIKKGKK